MADWAGATARDVLLDVSAALATRDEAALARSLRVAAERAEPEAVDEVLLQAHLFVGFPIALEAFSLWRRIAPGRAAAAVDGAEVWEARGREVCARVYGRNYEALRQNVRAIHPDLDAWMATGGYGRVIGRPGLDLVTRELCIVALLAVWNAPRQLHSHLRGALNVGAARAEVAAALYAAYRHLDPPRVAAVHALWERVGGDHD